jgi:hypothetical protein
MTQKYKGKITKVIVAGILQMILNSNFMMLLVL